MKHEWSTNVIVIIISIINQFLFYNKLIWLAFSMPELKYPKWSNIIKVFKASFKNYIQIKFSPRVKKLPPYWKQYHCIFGKLERSRTRCGALEYTKIKVQVLTKSCKCENYCKQLGICEMLQSLKKKNNMMKCELPLSKISFSVLIVIRKGMESIF